MRGERWLPPGVSADIRQTTNSAPPGAMHAVLDEASFRGAVCQPAAPFFVQSLSGVVSCHGMRC